MDRVRIFFLQGYDAVLLGNFSEPISVEQFVNIEEGIKEMEERTGLKIIITEFHADGDLNQNKIK